MDLYKTENKLGSRLQAIKDAGFNPVNVKAIFSFDQHNTAKGLTDTSRYRYLNHLIKLATWIKEDFKNKPFRQMTKKDIVKLVADRIERGKFNSYSYAGKGNKEKKILRKTTDYSPRTKREYKMTLKLFYKHIEGEDKRFPEKVEWIDTNFKQNDKLLPADLPTQEDLEALIRACDNPRDKAFMALLFDSGLRIGEIVNLKVKDVVDDSKTGNCYVRAKGKTGERLVRIIPAEPYIKSYLNVYEFRKEPNKPLFVMNGRGNQKAITYNMVQRLFKHLKKKTGITKRLNPHSFRHASATFMSKYLSDTQMDARYGWQPGSKMTGIYTHLSGKDTDEAVGRAYGVEEGKGPERIKVRVSECPRCHFKNPPGEKYCVCGLPLDLKELAKQTQDKQDRVTKLEKEIKNIQSSLKQELLRAMEGYVLVKKE